MANALKLVFFVVSICSALAADLLTVSTTQGIVKGHYTAAGTREWKGIQYAQAPVGEMRWQYPVAPAASSRYEGGIKYFIF